MIRRAGQMQDTLAGLVKRFPPIPRNNQLRILLEVVLEVVLVVIFLKFYNGVRNKFGSTKCTPEYALGHAQQVIYAEKVLGLFWEQEIQSAVLRYREWIVFWNIFYGTAHMAVTVFVLGFLFGLKPIAYQRCRTIFMIMNLIAISGYALYPLMPPRLVNDCNDEYGGCLKGYHWVDTMDEFGGLWSWKNKGISKVSNHYAAMPSMHAGYSIWCSLSMYEHSPFTLFRVLAVLYPLTTLYCIVVTANHYFMDAIFGVLCYFLAKKLASCMPQLGRGAPASMSLTTEPGPGDNDAESARLTEMAASAEEGRALLGGTNGEMERETSQSSQMGQLKSRR